MDVEESEMNMLSEDDDEEDDESGDGSSESDEESGDDDDDDDSESEEEIVEEEVPDKNSMKAGGSKSCSSDDDPERESCPICLSKFKGQELGTPESCEHTFCFDCIQEWSRNINTCPIDRTEFNNIYVRVTPGGTVLRKVKVKVLPKEPEDALTDSVTLCEVCHRGNREDRLLLCDGCDLAYHCDCLDPPLFYIPIEEWFCPPCSGVFGNRSVAGPSRARNTTRRAIPRTRASEAVRSRVQNLRGGPSRSSSSKRTNTSGTPKRKRRKVYRKAIKKVVTLARTKKDMSGGLKGKLGSRGSTVIITYRRRKRRRKTKRRVSRKSTASNKAISIQSSKVRIAKRLGISKPLQGSTVPQVQQSAGSRSRSVALMDKMPSHALFGNRDQLMDFSENFSEDLRNNSTPSTSSRRPSTSSSSSSINILDSILAGQKILHAKPDNVLIKTDGSLIIKESGSSVKKQESVKKLEVNRPSHTPMSVALAKAGVRTSVSEKSSSSWKKHSGVSKTKNISDKKVSDCSNFESKLPEYNKYSANHTKLYTNSKNNFNKIDDKSDLNRNPDDKRRLSSLKIKDDKLANAEFCKSANIKSRSESHNFNNPNSSFSDTSLKTSETCKKTSILSDIARDNLSNFFSPVSLPTTSSRFSKTSYKIPRKKETLNEEARNDNVATSISKVKIKQEVFSAGENDCDFASTKTEKIRIKQEVLSDEETKDDCHSENGNINDVMLSNIKKEPTDSDQRLNSIVFDAELSKDSENNINEKMSASENNSPDFDASQSIIDSLSHDVSFSSNARNTNVTPFQKIKEEVPSDSEEFSQSLLFSNDTQNSDAYSSCKSSVIQNKVPLDSDSSCKIKKRDNTALKISGTRDSDFISSSLSDKAAKSNDFSDNEIESEDDDFPCTQALVTEPNISDDDDDDNLPSTQAVSKVAIAKLSANSDSDDGNDDDDDAIPSAQAPAPDVSDSDNDSNSTSAHDAIVSDDDDDDNNLPPTQLPVLGDVSFDDEDDLPCTQAVFFDTSKEKTMSTSTVFSTSRTVMVHKNIAPSQCDQLKNHKNIDDLEEEIPQTQANFDFLKPAPILNCNSHINSDQDELPPTQATSFTVPHRNISNVLDHQGKSTNSKTLTSSGFNLDHINNLTLPSTQVVSNPCTKQGTTSKPKKDHNLEPSDLPATQKSDSLQKSAHEFDLPDTQVFKLPFEKSNIEKAESTNKSYDLPSTEMSLPDTQDFPATQISNPDLNVSAKENIEAEVDTQCLKNILSNIKQLVNSLSVKDINNPDIQKTSEDISKNCTSDLSSNISDFAAKVPEQSNAQNKTDDSRETTSKKEENQKNPNYSSDSENEDLSPEEIKEALKKSSKPVTPKKSGIHKHLPQVIAAIPVKEHLKIKPSCKRTFSFEEVAKLEGPVTQQKVLKNSSLKTVENKKIPENTESSSSDSEDFLPATQRVDVLNTNTESSNEDSLPATQIQCNENFSATLKGVKNGIRSTGIQKRKLPSASEKETENFPANGFFPENFPANGFFPEKFKSRSDTSKAKSSAFDHMDSDDLPATQLCQNIVKEKIIKNKGNSDSTTNLKRKFSSDVTALKKRASEQNINDSLKTKSQYLSDASRNITPSVRKSTKILKCEELPNFDEKLNTVKSNKKQIHYEPLLNNKLKDKYNSLSLDYEKELSSKIIDSLTEKHLNNKDNNQKVGICHPIKIKQEKNDFEFIKPSTNIPLLKSEKAVFCSDFNGIKIKTEDPDDLPLTQAVNFNSFDDDSLPPTQVTVFEEKTKTNKGECDSTVCEKILSASEIKKEPCLDNDDDDDDEVAVIELNSPSRVKVKEEIILSDDDDLNENIISKVSAQNPVDMIQEGKVTSSKTIGISSKKREKYDVNRVSLVCTSEIKARKISNEDLQNAIGKNSVEKHKPKIKSVHNESEFVKSHKYNKHKKEIIDGKDFYPSKEKSVDSHNFAANCSTGSKESHSFKGEKAKDSKVSKEKRRISEDSYKSVEKSSKNCKNSSSSKDKTKKTSKDFYKSVETVEDNQKTGSNKISKESHSSKHKSRKMSEDSHENQKTSKESHSSRQKSGKVSEDSHESHKSSKESHSSKQQSRKMSKDSHESPKNTKESQASKEKIRKTSEEPHTSKDKSRSKVDGCASDIKSSKSSKDYYTSDKRSRKFSEDSNFSAEEKGKKYIENESKHQRKSSLKGLHSKSKEKEHETENSNYSSSRSSCSSKDIEISKNSSSRDKEQKNNPSKSPHSKEQNKTSSSKGLKFRHSVSDAKKIEVPLNEREKNVSAKERRCSEKENDSMSKSKNDTKDILSTLKPTNKRPHEHSVDTNNMKKRKLDHSSMPESYGGEDILIQLSDIHNSVLDQIDFGIKPTSTNFNIKTDTTKIADEMEIDNVTNISYEMDQPKSPSKDLHKLFRKQELKEEIANEVKLVLKPFYSTCLISKEDYKDIMRRAVPKIFMNCHNCINPEKIRKLVLNYVSLINKS